MYSKKSTENRGYFDADAIVDRMRLAADLKSDGRLAEYLGVSRSAVSNWRQAGKVPMRRVVQVHKATDVRLEWLLHGTGNQRESSRPLVVASDGRPISTPRDLDSTPHLIDGALLDIAMQDARNTLKSLGAKQPIDLVGYGWLVANNYWSTRALYMRFAEGAKMTRDEILSAMREAAGLPRRFRLPLPDPEATDAEPDNGN